MTYSEPTVIMDLFNGIIINVVSGLILATIMVSIYFSLMFLSRVKPGNEKFFFISVLGNHIGNSYRLEEQQINRIVAEVEYGIKADNSCEEYKKLSATWDYFYEVFGNSNKTIDSIVNENLLPKKRNLIRKFWTFIKLWYSARDDDKNYYYRYFKLCNKIWK